ncbi:MAG: filamentous hemagglutinin family protein [Methylophilus sp.]|nr:filamentous hemagglutinin family protein [Methylophilus sp.]
MNSGIYRLVFNATRGLWMVVSEHVCSHQSGTDSTARSQRRLHLRAERKSQSRKSTMYILLLGMALSGNFTLALAGTLAAGTLPTDLVGGAGIVINTPSVNIKTNINELNITQSAVKGIITGTNFSLGSASAVNFNHLGGTGSATLIRINGSKSVIEGALNSPKGKIFLINQSGILFANGSRVNVNGLVASALDLKDDDFLSELTDLNPYANGERAAYIWGGSATQFSEALVQVEPDANIKAALGGSIMMFAPKVINQGSLETTEGQVVMAAGEKVYLSVAPQLVSELGDGYVYSKDSPYRALAGVLVEVDSYQKATPNEIVGKVVNDTMGRILAQRGNVTLAGFMVNQDGRVTATSSVNQKGSVRLLARDTVTKLEATTANITEPVGEVVDGKLANGNPIATYADLTSKAGVRSGDIITGARAGELNIGKDSITTVLAEDKAAVYKVNEIFTQAQIGEPAAKQGEKSYTQKVLEAVNVQSQTVTEDQIFNPPTIEAVGRKVNIGDNAKIVVPGGYVSVLAQKSGAGFNYVDHANEYDEQSRLFLGKNTVIDVSGLKNVEVNMERNFVEQLLTLTDLKDDPINRDGFLYRKKVWFDIRDLPDSKVADLAGFVKQVPRSLGEKLSTGGSAVLKSEGDLIQSVGSKIDVSGGSLKFNAGINKESWLLGANGKSYALGEAPVDTLFTGFLGGKNSRELFEKGYIEGKTAGSLELASVNMALDGQFSGGAIYGERQRESANLGGKFSLSVLAPQNTFGKDINLSSDLTPLNGNFSFTDTLPETRSTVAQLSGDTINNSKFAEVKLNTTGGVKINSQLNLEDGAKLTINNGSTTSLNEINQNITMHGGTVNITNAKVADNVVIDTSGNWTNDVISAPSQRVITKGGKVTLELAQAIGENTLIDVSGGGWLQRNQTLVKGNAGSIIVKSNSDAKSLVDGSVEYRGYALGVGGNLSIQMPNLTVSDNQIGTETQAVIRSDFFQSGGFTSYDLISTSDLYVKSDANVDVVAKNYVLNADFIGKSTGQKIHNFAQTKLLPDYLRQSTSLALSTNAPITLTDVNTLGLKPQGSVVVEAGAKLAVNSNGLRKDTNGQSVAPSIALSAWNNQLFVDGTLEAKGGNITLTMNQGNILSADDIGYNPAQSIWLGKNALLDVSGYAVLQPNASGLRKGSVYDAGKVTINAQKGYVMAETGSEIDVSGTSAVFDVKNTTGYSVSKVAGNAGEVSITAREGIWLDSSFNAKSDGGLAGSIELNLTRRGAENLERFQNVYPGTVDTGAGLPVYLPNQLWYVELSQNNLKTPELIKVGDSLEPSISGLAKVSANSLMDGGFADIVLRAEHGIKFVEDVKLQASRSIELDARTFEAGKANMLVNIVAPHVTLSNDDKISAIRSNFSAADALQGSSTFNVNAELIDLNGKFSLSGFQNSQLTSLGDIRLTGVSTGTSQPVGQLLATGNLVMNARQIYATTFSDYNLSVLGDGGQVSFNKLNANDDYDVVLSAASRLSVNAETINQNGVLLAPFGKIDLIATKTLNLNDGSVTSVASQGALIPFGLTKRAGLNYFYNFITGETEITAMPERIVKLTAPTVNQNQGSTVDISAGGDLLAYEWIKGIGGSADVLANDAQQSAFGQNVTNTWAVMPASNSTFASYDTQYWSGSHLSAGDAVYLTGVAGLKDGYYTLMPARYALLPGAMLVSAVSGYQDRSAGLTQTLQNGASLVSGHLASYTSNGYQQTSRTGGFIVRPGSDAKTLAQYNTTNASDFFKADSQSQQVADAGRVSIAATASLTLQGSLNALVAQGGRGAEMDIAAPNLLVVDEGGLTGQVDLDGKKYLAIDEKTLADFNVASLLLGGTRESGSINVISSDVRLGANSNVSASEVMLVATEEVKLDSGSSLVGSGQSAVGKNLTIGNVDRAIDGDGVYVRVAGGKATNLTRVNTDNNRGLLSVDSSATIKGEGTVQLDASKDYQINGGIDFDKNAALTFTSSHISLGSSNNGQIVDGLSLTKAQLNKFVDARSLKLVSRSTVDLFGDLAFGNKNFNLDIESAGLAGYQNEGKAVTITANNFSLSNSTATNFINASALSSGVVPQLGTGSLKVEATKIEIGDNITRIAGFEQVELAASQAFLAKNNLAKYDTVPESKLSVDSNLSISAPVLTINKNVHFTVEAGADALQNGVLKVQGTKGAQPALVEQSSQGAKFKLTADSVIVEGGTNDAANTSDRHGASIIVKGGLVEIEAKGAGSNASVIVGGGAKIDVGGTAFRLNDQTADLAAGEVKLISNNGNVEVQKDAVVDLSASGTANAGRFSVKAVNGEAKLQGRIVAATAGNVGKNAQAAVDAKTLNFSDAIQAFSGFSGSQSYRVRQGDLTLQASEKIVAKDVTVEVSQGAININGVIDSSGDTGGHINLYANNNLTVASGAQLLAKGTADKTSTAGTLGDGGEVLLSSKSGAISVVAPNSTGELGALIDVTGDSKGSVKGDGGVVTYRVYDINKLDTQSTGAVTGAKQVVISPVKTYETTTLDSALLANVNQDVATTKAGINQLNYQSTRDGKNATVLPEAELVSSTNLQVSTNAVLGAVAGVLSLKAAENLNVNANIDALASTSANSWNIRLAAGADNSSANPEAVNVGLGDITLNNDTYVRTGVGSIHALAGNDINLGASGARGAAIYTKGEASVPDPAGFVRLSDQAREFYGDNGGDVLINVGGSVLGSQSYANNQSVYDWFTQSVNNTLADKVNPQARWWQRDLSLASGTFATGGFRNGIAALGGGDVNIKAGGDVTNLQLATATSGRMGGAADTAPTLANFVETGGGDLSVDAKGDINKVLLHVGHGELVAQSGKNLSAELSLMDAKVNLLSNGDLEITKVANPTARISKLNGNNYKVTFNTYTNDTAIQATSFNGDISLTGALPSQLSLVASSGSLLLTDVVMYPSATGQANLMAGQNVEFNGFVMSDVNPLDLNSVTTSRVNKAVQPTLSNYVGLSGHTEGGLHANDFNPVTVYAANDVTFSESPLVIPKALVINAGNDVVDPNIIVQNNRASDVSVIKAGNDIRYTDLPPQNGVFLAVNAGVQVAGPGRLHMIAGDDINFGPSSGVVSIGNSSTKFYNPYLTDSGADILVQTGATVNPDYQAMIDAYLDKDATYSNIYIPQLLTYMKALKADNSLSSEAALEQFKALSSSSQAAFINQIFFSELQASGREAGKLKSDSYGDYSRAERAILRMFPNFTSEENRQQLLAKSGSIMEEFAKIANEPISNPGDLSLFYSQIKSERGGKVEMLVPTGFVNAGLEVSGGVAKSDSELGIVSLRGGEMLGFVRGDFQVNQSRVFTLGGSDLMLYSALESIDAGKGSKTASSTPPPVVRIVNGQVVFDYSGAVTGSGIAALTATGGAPGNVDLYAPYGEINAGEAGIRSAGNINLGARVIIGADNISAGGVTSGVPAVSATGLSLAVPASADASATGKQGDQLADSTKQGMGNKLAALPSIISVEVMSLGDDAEPSTKPNKKSCDKSDKNRKDCAD